MIFPGLVRVRKGELENRRWNWKGRKLAPPQDEGSQDMTLTMVAGPLVPGNEEEGLLVFSLLAGRVEKRVTAEL